ncbi:hypothetical protein ACFQMM_23235 [Saliphagus sp. GCM10025308]
MIVSDTVLRDEPSERTQRTVPGYVSWALSRTGIDRMSKGLVAYEVLHLAYDEYEDALSRHEAALFEQLDDEAGTDTREMLDYIVMSRESTARTDLIKECEFEPPEESMPADLHFPAEFVDALPSYALADHLEHAIVYAAASPWTSRLDRMDDLQDLLLWTRGVSPNEPSHFVEEVVSGESRKWDVERLHDRLSPDVERYERSDLTIDDLRHWGEDIKQVPSARAQALETALSNEDTGIPYQPKGVRVRATEIYGDVTDETAHRYAALVDLETVNENVETIDLDVDALIERLEDEAYDGASVDSIRKMKDMEDWEIAGFEDDPRDHGGLTLVEMADDELDKLDNLRADGAGPMSGTIKVAGDNSRKVGDWIREKRAEVEERTKN